MSRSREQLLIALFVTQIIAAAILAAVLVNGVHDDKPTRQVISAGGAPVGAGAPTDGGTAPAATTSESPTAAGVTTEPGGGLGTAAAPVRGGAATTVASGPTTSATKAGPTKTGATSAKATAATGKSEIAAGAPIKVGSIVTQNAAINFKSSALGTKAYFDMINAQGGIAGHKIQLELLDDQLSKPTGRNEYTQLANDGVFTMAAFNAPDTEGGLQDLIDSYKIPLIGSYGEYAEYHDQYAYAFSADYVHYGYAMGAELKALGVQHPALIFVDNMDANANGQIESGFTAGYGKTWDYEAVKAPTDTYQSDITQMRLKNIDGLASILDPGSYVRFLQAAGSYEQQIKHVADPLYATSTVTSQSNADGAYIASDYAFITPSDPNVKAYLDAVHADFGNDAQTDYIGLVGWTDAKILVDALKSMNGVFTKAGLLQALSNLGTYQTGVSAPLQLSGGNRDVNKCLQIGKLSGTTVEPVSGYTCDTQKA